MYPTIYVSVPNYFDSEIYRTIEDIFKNADHPENIYVGLAHNMNPQDRDIIKTCVF